MVIGLTSKLKKGIQKKEGNNFNFLRRNFKNMDVFQADWFKIITQEERT